MSNLEIKVHELELEVEKLKNIIKEKNNVVNDNLFIIRRRLDRDRNYYKLMGSIVVSIVFFFMAKAYCGASEELAHICAIIVVCNIALVFFFLSIEVVYCIEDSIYKKRINRIFEKIGNEDLREK